MKSWGGFAFLLVIILFASGCAHLSKPGQVPEIALTTVGSYTEKLSVDLVNNQPDTTPQPYWVEGIHTHSANYNEWTQFFIDRFAEEIEKRGVEVSRSSPNKLKVKLSDFSVIKGLAKIRANMKIKLEMPDKNWEKEWVATDTSGWTGGRAFASAIYHTIEELLQNPELIERLNVR